MSLLVTITTITANTPVDVYYCDSFSASCVFVETRTIFPFQFSVPPPYADNNVIVKIIDSQTCEVLKLIPFSSS